MQDDFAFFKKILSALFDKLGLKESIIDCFNLCVDYFPIELIAFNQYSNQSKMLDNLFVVTKNGYFSTGINILLTKEQEQELKQYELNRNIVLVTASDSVQLLESFNLAIQKYLPYKSRFALLAILTVGNDILGHLLFIAKPKEVFTKEHERKLGMLTGFFSMAISNSFKVQNLIEDKQKTEEEIVKLEHELNFLSNYELIGGKTGLKDIVTSIYQLEDKDVPALILGETGTGKELIANAIQKSSKRCNKPFIKVNCGAIPETLIISELFGHEKGAFTGADQIHAGRFEQAHTGTLFLDEVGDLSLQAQVYLLRVLEDGIVNRVGGTKPMLVDVRVIAATNKDLNEMRHKGLFREDLFHRLNIFPIEVPPLRKRKGDIPLLMGYFINKIAMQRGFAAPRIDEASIPILMQYDWLGNVRELENLVERALIFETGGSLDISKYLKSNMPLVSQGIVDDVYLKNLIDDRVSEILKNEFMLSSHSATSPSVDYTIKEYIEQALEKCQGKVYGSGGAAEMLDMKDWVLRHSIKKLGIDMTKWNRRSKNKFK